MHLVACNLTCREAWKARHNSPYLVVADADAYISASVAMGGWIVISSQDKP